jgi:hypothetical protein
MEQVPLIYLAIPAVAIVGVAAGSLFWWLGARRHTRSLRALARKHGWRYSRTVPVPWRLWRGGVFSERPKFLSAHQGVTGVTNGVGRFTSFELLVADEQDNSKPFHVLALPLDVDLGLVHMAHTRTATRARQGRQAFEWAEFNATWQVVEDLDARITHGLISPLMMETLMAAGDALDHVVFTGRHLVSWRPGGQDPAAIIPGVTALSSVRSQVPTWLAEELS